MITHAELLPALDKILRRAPLLDRPPLQAAIDEILHLRSLRAAWLESEQPVREPMER